jgi:hypothetical protein
MGQPSGSGHGDQEKGLPYQTYIKMLLREALKRERSA